MFKNRVLRKILGLNRDKGVGEWRQLHNEELYEQYLSPNIMCSMQFFDKSVTRNVPDMNFFHRLCIQNSPHNSSKEICFEALCGLFYGQ